jgi:glycosyltransferase involved in cell wall biosynthesis
MAATGAPAAGRIPRHVLMTTDAVGGVWNYSIDLCRALNAAKVPVLLACLGPQPAPDMAAAAEALPRTRLVAMDQPLDWLASQPGELQQVPRRIEELATAHGIDLLHLNAASQAAGLRTALPVVVAAHSCVATWWDAMRDAALPDTWGWQAELNARGMQRAEMVIAPSEGHASALRRVYGPIDGLAVVPNAISTGPSAMPAPARRRDIVIAAGRWWDEAKNAAVLDRAAALLRWPVLAAGACHGVNGQSFSFEAAQPLGALTHGQLRSMMREAAVFVSPSLYEPFGLAALEAAEAGAALVLADIPTYRENWEGTALFFDPRQPEALARAVGAYAGDPGLRRTMAAKATARAADFTPARQLRGVLAAYDAAMAKARNPADAVT